MKLLSPYEWIVIICAIAFGMAIAAAMQDFTFPLLLTGPSLIAAVIIRLIDARQSHFDTLRRNLR